MYIGKNDDEFKRLKQNYDSLVRADAQPIFPLEPAYRSPFSGWHEGSKDFVVAQAANFCDGARAIPDEYKAAYVFTKYVRGIAPKEFDDMLKKARS